MTMDEVELGSKLDDCVTSLIGSGRFATRTDVLREGVRLLAAHEQRLATLDGAIARGLADSEAGRVRSLDAVAEWLKKRDNVAQHQG
jgi:antitoxin ParD1/3/4